MLIRMDEIIREVDQMRMEENQGEARQQRPYRDQEPERPIWEEVTRPRHGAYNEGGRYARDPIMGPAGWTGPTPRQPSPNRIVWRSELAQREPGPTVTTVRRQEEHRPGPSRSGPGERYENFGYGQRGPGQIKPKKTRPPKEVRDWETNHPEEPILYTGNQKEDHVRGQYRRRIMSLEAQIAGREEAIRDKAEAERKRQQALEKQSQEEKDAKARETANRREQEQSEAAGPAPTGDRRAILAAAAEKRYRAEQERRREEQRRARAEKIQLEVTHRARERHEEARESLRKAEDELKMAKKIAEDGTRLLEEAEESREARFPRVIEEESGSEGERQDWW